MPADRGWVQGRRWPAAAAALGCALLVAACGGGGSGASADAVATALGEVGCQNDLVVSVRGALLHNNTWNAAASPAAGQQCLLVENPPTAVVAAAAAGGRASMPGADAVGWQWNWPEGSTQVLAYPGLVFGTKPWPGRPGGVSSDDRLPVRVGALSALSLNLQVQAAATGAYNQAVSMWLIDGSAADNLPNAQAVRAEVMVVTRAQGPDWLTGRTADAVVDIGGRRWQVFHAPNWADASGQSDVRWTFVTYVAEDAAAAVASEAVAVDLQGVLAHARSRGWIDPDWWVADVEFGTEIVGGQGAVSVSDWSLVVR